MNTLLAATVALSDLLEQENAALRVHDFVLATAHGETKRDALNHLAAVQADIAQNQEPAAQKQVVSSVILAKLRSRLDNALAENKRLLETAIGIQSQVIAIVLRSVEAPGHPAYRGNGNQTAPVLPVALTVRA